MINNNTTSDPQLFTNDPQLLKGIDKTMKTMKTMKTISEHFYMRA